MMMMMMLYLCALLNNIQTIWRIFGVLDISNSNTEISMEHLKDKEKIKQQSCGAMEKWVKIFFGSTNKL